MPTDTLVGALIESPSAAMNVDRIMMTIDVADGYEFMIDCRTSSQCHETISTRSWYRITIVGHLLYAALSYDSSISISVKWTLSSHGDDDRKLPSCDAE